MSPAQRKPSSKDAIDLDALMQEPSKPQAAPVDPESVDASFEQELEQLFADDLGVDDGKEEAPAAPATPTAPATNLDEPVDVSDVLAKEPAAEPGEPLLLDESAEAMLLDEPVEEGAAEIDLPGLDDLDKELGEAGGAMDAAALDSLIDDISGGKAGEPEPVGEAVLDLDEALVLDEPLEAGEPQPATVEEDVMVLDDLLAEEPAAEAPSAEPAAEEALPLDLETDLGMSGAELGQEAAAVLDEMAEEAVLAEDAEASFSAGDALAGMDDLESPAMEALDEIGEVPEVAEGRPELDLDALSREVSAEAAHEDVAPAFEEPEEAAEARDVNVDELLDQIADTGTGVLAAGAADLASGDRAALVAEIKQEVLAEVREAVRAEVAHEILAQLEQAVPREAARIIREEIAALAREAGD